MVAKKLYPAWAGFILGLFSYLGIVLPGAVRRSRCANCGVSNVEHEARENTFSTGWVYWNSTHIHHAKCGLPCSNGFAGLLEELEKPISEREVHTGSLCPRCFPDAVGLDY